MLTSILPLTDVMSTGHHAAVSAGVQQGSIVANITLRGGVAPAHAYIPELLEDVVAGRIDPSPVLDLTVDLNGVPSGYAAMDGREVIKVMVRP